MGATGRNVRAVLAAAILTVATVVAIEVLPATAAPSQVYVSDTRNVCHLPRPGNNGHVTGHDIGWSVRNGSTVYWFFGDTQVDTNSDGVFDRQVAGTIARSTDPDPSNCIDMTFKVDGDSNATPAVAPITGECTTWPGTGVVANSTVYIYFQSVPNCNGLGASTRLAKLTNATTMDTTRVSGTFWTSTQPQFGTPIKIGTTIYLFGIKPGTASVLMARVAESAIEQPGQYTYWQGGTTWTNNLTTARALFTGNDGAFTVSITYNATLNRFLAVYTCNKYTGAVYGGTRLDTANAICARTSVGTGSAATALTGGWNDETQLEHCQNDQNLARCYQAFLHSAYDTPGGPSYVTTARHYGSGYWVTLREVKLSTQPLPKREFWNSEYGFSGTQGKLNWRYQSSALGAPLTWNAAQNAWVGAESVGGSASPRVRPDFMAPGNVNPAVRLWTAPVAGTASVSGEAWIEKACSDGVDVDVLKVAGSTTTPLWSQRLYPRQSALLKKSNIVLASGDRLAFRVGKGPATAMCDATFFYPTVSFDQNELLRTSPNDFRDARPDHGSLLAPVQGFRGWRYEECAVNTSLQLSNCTLMTVASFNKDTNGGAFRGSETYSLLWAGGAHPPNDRYKTVSRAWTAPSSGSARITGLYADGQVCAGADGVYLAVYKNLATPLWGWFALAEGGSGAFDVTTPVNAGDVIRILVHRAVNNNTCDVTNIGVTMRVTG